jgi:hypothetical protein
MNNCMIDIKDSPRPGCMTFPFHDDALTLIAEGDEIIHNINWKVFTLAQRSALLLGLEPSTQVVRAYMGGRDGGVFATNWRHGTLASTIATSRHAVRR